MMFGLAVAAILGSQQFPIKSQLSLEFVDSIVPAGGVISAVLKVKMEPGWHSYWINPGDTGSAPRLTWKLPNGWKVARQRFEIPHRISSLGLTSYGYENEFKIATDFVVPNKIGAAQVSAEMDYLVCEETCIPQLQKASASVDVVKAVNPMNRRAKGPFPDWQPGVKAIASITKDTVSIRISGLDVSEEAAKMLLLFVEHPEIVNHEQLPTIATSGKDVIFTFKRSAYGSSQPKQFRALVTATSGNKILGESNGLTLNVRVSS
jgi:thiol:disulfide interchange protein DsbD